MGLFVQPGNCRQATSAGRVTNKPEVENVWRPPRRGGIYTNRERLFSISR